MLLVREPQALRLNLERPLSYDEGSSLACSVIEFHLDDIECMATLQATAIFRVPQASITFFSGSETWFKAAVSVKDPAYCPVSVRREHSLGSYALLTGKSEILVVEDTLEDARCAGRLSLSFFSTSLSQLCLKSARTSRS